MAKEDIDQKAAGAAKLPKAEEAPTAASKIAKRNAGIVDAGKEHWGEGGSYKMTADGKRVKRPASQDPNKADLPKEQE